VINEKKVEATVPLTEVFPEIKSEKEAPYTKTPKRLGF
jgi:hypothetical protein